MYFTMKYKYLNIKKARSIVVELVGEGGWVCGCKSSYID